jgi:hypothetical protein
MSSTQRFAAAALVVLVASTAWGWQLPLRVTEQWGQSGIRYVTGGVPLLAGQAKDPAELQVAVKDAGGNLTAVPAQFRVLARWWRADNSIRWVLVDLATALNESQTKTYILTNEKLAPPEQKDKLTVAQTDGEIVVTTGPAQFVINRKQFNFLDGVLLDINGDGQFTPDEQMLASNADCGTVLEDTYGTKYYATKDTQSVEVIERGPMRVCVRAKGVHRDREGKGYSKGMYQFDVFLNFYAGSTDVKTDVVIANNFAQSIGSPTFEDASLYLKLAGGAKAFRMYGEAPLDGKFVGDESYALIQDSNGAETWRIAQGFYGPCLGSYRGYKVFARHRPGFEFERVSPGGYEFVQLKAAEGSKAVEEEITQGGQARGLVRIANGRGGIVMHTQFFWEQFPKGVEVSGDGTLRLAMFPREYKAPHYLEDASGKGHSVILHFYATKQKNRYATDDGGHTWPHVVADCWDYPVFPMPTAEHKAACGALTDVGPYTVPTRGFETWPLEIHYRRMLMTDKYWGNGFGWQVFGSRWQAHGGHSSRGARQPIKEDCWLYRYYTTEDRNWQVYGEIRSRHFRDVRCFRIEGQDPFGFKNWDDFSKHNRSEDYTNRRQPSDEEYKKFSQGIYGRSTWWLPNPAHQTLDLPYDRYLLYGDQRAFEDMPIIAAHGGYYIAYRNPYVHRETGWSYRAITRYWDLTGDPKAWKVIDDALNTYKPLIGKTPLVCGEGDNVNWWFTQVFSRGVSILALQSGDPRALDLCKTLAVGKESRAEYFCTLFAVLYHLTGEQKYKDAVLKATGGTGDRLLVVDTSGDFPATAYWLIHQPPRKKP